MRIVSTLVAGCAMVVFSNMAAAAAQEATQGPLVYDYAVNHPTEDADLQNMPSIGASVPQGIVLATVDGTEGVYGYFYFQGRPVIVDIATRSIVRIGD